MVTVPVGPAGRAVTWRAARHRADGLLTARGKGRQARYLDGVAPMAVLFADHGGAAGGAAVARRSARDRVDRAYAADQLCLGPAAVPLVGREPLPVAGTVGEVPHGRAAADRRTILRWRGRGRPCSALPGRVARLPCSNGRPAR